MQMNKFDASQIYVWHLCENKLQLYWEFQGAEVQRR